jgi:hypothetical protein
MIAARTLPMADGILSAACKSRSNDTSASSSTSSRSNDSSSTGDYGSVYGSTGSSAGGALSMQQQWLCV